MRALRFNEFGDFDRLHVVDVPDPAAGPGELIVQMRAASLNPSDAKNVLGRMEGTTLPRTPGRDFAGVVVQGPPEMLGREVWGSGGDVGFTRDGAHAEAIVVPIDGVRPKPARLSFEEAATVGVNFLAAWVGLVGRAHLQAGDTLLITGAGGGVGAAAGQIARWIGARALGADRNPMPEDRRRDNGLEEFVVLDGSDGNRALIDAAMQFSGGRGVSVCFDTVGGPLFEPCLQSLSQLGRQVNIASAGERRVCFDLLDFYHHRLSLFGVDTRALDTRASAQILERLASGFESGAFRPIPIARRYRLDQAREAYLAVHEGNLRGKAVFTFAD